LHCFIIAVSFIIPRPVVPVRVRTRIAKKFNRAPDLPSGAVFFASSLQKIR